MKIILAVDLKDNYVVHGCCGNRAEYKPLNWGLSPSAEPFSYISVMKPKYLYAADLDRIEMCGDHTEIILKLKDMVDELYVDRGATLPEEYVPGIKNIVGTETAEDLGEFKGGFLSIDVKDGRVIPDGLDPLDLFRLAQHYSFDGFILLNISSVGTESGIDETFAQKIRAATKKPLYWGGGVSSLADLDTLSRLGFDGAIISTAVHKGRIPLEIVQEGEYCW
ncbi:MAG TPA: HisA/HisF-related TIM barrel protein [Methanocorpusculum sp.]|nr:HisA/HisF-related TIM barrel protein [Methanocorpusculum sp.]